MKITRLCFGMLICLILFSFSAFAQDVSFATEGAKSSNPFLDLLTAKYGWIATALAYFTAFRVGIIPIFSVKIRHFMFDKMNEIAASSDQDDDAYLTELFSAKWYKLTAFILRFIGVTLPTMADLTRALELQKQAVTNAEK